MDEEEKVTVSNGRNFKVNDLNARDLLILFY